MRAFKADESISKRGHSKQTRAFLTDESILERSLRNEGGNIEENIEKPLSLTKSTDQTEKSKENAAKTAYFEEITVNTMNSTKNVVNNVVSRDFSYVTLQNTGQSAVVRVECQRREQKPFITQGLLPLRNRYVFEQLHFHWANCDAMGSEHMIDSQKYVKSIIFVPENGKKNEKYRL